MAVEITAVQFPGLDLVLALLALQPSQTFKLQATRTYKDLHF